MKISHVKPEIENVEYYFDHNHQFFTKVKVYFQHHSQSLRAVLIFPLHKKGHFILDKIEVYYNEQWTEKRGNPNLYGMALMKNVSIVLLGKKITGLEQIAKNELEQRFQNIVEKLADSLEQEISPHYPMECEISPDYLTIITNIKLGKEFIEGKVETNNPFASNMNDKEFLQTLITNYTTQILDNIKKLNMVQAERKEPQKVYLTTIPLLNPVLEGHHRNKKDIHVSIYSEGNCEKCNQTVWKSIKSSVHIDLDRKEEQKLDFIVTIIDDHFICDECNAVVKKDKIIMKDYHTGQIVFSQILENTFFLGYMNKQESHKQIVLAALNHDSHFQEHKEAFWNAYAYIATVKWDTFVHELSEIELKEALRAFTPLPANASREDLILMVKGLALSEEDKRIFWRRANETVINYYLFITIFGWNMEREIAIVGPNRAEFIFSYFPVPKELKAFHKIHTSYFLKKEVHPIGKQQQSLDQQRQQIKILQQENGRLAEKLGTCHDQLSKLEQESYRLITVERNKNDILKIQHLKGLIEELKTKIAELSISIDQEEIIDSVVLTVDPIEKEEQSFEQVLDGKNVFIIGGTHSTQSKVGMDSDINLFIHDARNLDNHFYHYLKSADMVIVLTRYISHQAMWEAKEYAILEEKPIFYTTFTNIPTILSSIAYEYVKREKK